MTRVPALLLVAVLTAALPGVAVADPLSEARTEWAARDRDGQDPRRDAPEQRADRESIVRDVSRGRPGRRVGVRSEGDDVVVIWEYPGGRIAEIVVDGRTGRIRGER